MFELPEQHFEEVKAICRSRVGGPKGMRADVLRLKHKLYANSEIAEILEITPRTVFNVLGYYRGGGLEKALNDDPRPGRPKIFDDRDKCQIIAMVCSNPPEGFDRWSLSLIADQAVKKGIVEKISDESIRIFLHEHDLKPWQQKMWCIPDLNKEFKERMEKVLDLYSLEHSEEIPLVCLDEKPVPLTGETRETIPMKPGSIQKKDFEYTRHGSCNVFFAFEPQTGVYWAEATKRRTADDFADFLADLAANYADSKKVNLVLDNLNIHREKSLIQRFGEENGSAVWNHFNIFYTPIHGSWLNQAEIGIGMFSRQCLGGTRIPDFKTLRKKTKAWVRYINDIGPTVNWEFTSDEARLKFKYG